MPAAMEIRRAADRAVTRTSWLQSRHSFSFADHYDPDNTHHGLLLVNNDDLVQPAAGFDTHPHRDMEIVTWVLQGALAHQDSTGNRGVIYPGLAQRMSAGSGILHSEKNESVTEPVHFVQMWVIPDEAGHLAGLPAVRDRRGPVARQPGDRRLGHTRARRGHHPAQPQRRAARRAVAARRRGRVCPRRPTCTCSLRAAGSPSRESATSKRATRSGSPTPTAGG